MKKSTSLVESDIQTNAKMADNRTMAQMLQAPIEGYEDAIVVPPINTNNFELKQTLINLVQSNQFTGRQDPHNHLRFFNKVTSTKSSSLVESDIQTNAKMADNRTMAQMLQAPIEGYEDAIVESDVILLSVLTVLVLREMEMGDVILGVVLFLDLMHF
nr:putative athila retroelement ORF1 protein [Tanacetum cinerariifolium]